MKSSPNQRYQSVMQRAGEIADLESAGGLLSWDQETKMPRKGVSGRAHVLATMAGVMHEKLTHPALGEDLRALQGEELGEVEAAQVHQLLRDHERASRVPRDLVERMAKSQSEATAVWAEARAAKNFEPFAPHVERNFALKREMAEAIGYEEDPYDALLEEYEPGARIKTVWDTLQEMRRFLVPVVQAIRDAGGSPDDSLTAGPYDAEAQDRFGRTLVQAMGFDMEAGRLDLSNHPFTSGLHHGDTRLTTRYKGDLSVGLFGTLHEAGHGLYEQNLPEAMRRTPLGPSVSLGVHESQSRLWENVVGRGRHFWEHFFPRIQKHFPDRLGSASLDDFYRAVNRVHPSLIRIESDEVTYNLHIILRVGLEREMIGERLRPRDLPEAWNARFQEDLGITPPSPDVGVLQDIHWAAGHIGYFATYSLGNIYASQFYEAAKRAVPDLESRIRSGDLITLRDWLVEHVHRWGRRYPAAELIERATGKPPALDDFKEYIAAKFGAMYGIEVGA